MNKFRITPASGIQYILETELGLNQVEASLSAGTDVQPFSATAEAPVEVVSESVKKRKAAATK